MLKNPKLNYSVDHYLSNNKTCWNCSKLSFSPYTFPLRIAKTFFLIRQKHSGTPSAHATEELWRKGCLETGNVTWREEHTKRKRRELYSHLKRLDVSEHLTEIMHVLTSILYKCFIYNRLLLLYELLNNTRIDFCVFFDATVVKAKYNSYSFLAHSLYMHTIFKIVLHVCQLINIIVIFMFSTSLERIVISYT